MKKGILCEWKRDSIEKTPSAIGSYWTKDMVNAGTKVGQAFQPDADAPPGSKVGQAFEPDADAPSGWKA
jgi:hypothetical protein